MARYLKIEDNKAKDITEELKTKPFVDVGDPASIMRQELADAVILLKSEFKKYEKILELIENNGLDYDEIERAIDQQILTAEKEAYAAKLLNKNLIRIAKERANAKRNIKNKKLHDGYIVIYSKSFKVKRKVDKNKEYNKRQREILKELEKNLNFEPKMGATEYVKSLPDWRDEVNWKTVIQTPVEASIPLDAVESYFKDFIDRFTSQMKIRDNTENASGNILIGIGYNANYRAGFWEIEILHTESLGEIPEEFRNI